jgi:hypothetical protein
MWIIHSFAASIPSMPFTDRRCKFASAQPTLQFFSVKVDEILGGLRWPIDVYGIVAVRDVVDHNRNIIFHRKRGNSHTLTEEDPYLPLTGPTRAVVVTVHPTYFEVDLKVKGAVESEDRDFSFLALCYSSQGPTKSCVLYRAATSRLSTLRFTFAQIVDAVEATLVVQVLGGEWPLDYRKGAFTAMTASVKGMPITLIAFQDGKLPVDDDGQVTLSRRVVCVELGSPEDGMKPKLMVTLKALHINKVNGKVERYLSFKPKKNGRSHRTIKVNSCEMRVTVGWSLLSTVKCSCYDKDMSSARAV